MKRVAVLGVFLESNAFAPVFDKKSFENGIHLIGDEITRDARSERPRLMKEVPGFYREMDRIGGWEPVPILITGGMSGGPADANYLRETIERMRKMLTECLPVDGVYMPDHGAMTATEGDDAEGEIYQMVRDVVGPDVPFVASLDLHANLSQRMVDLADVVVSYRTDPHVDQAERGGEAARILHELWAGTKPYVFNLRLPIVAPNVSLFTADGPLGDLIRHGQDSISEDIMNVTILGGFAFSDTPKNGLHIVVTGRNRPEPAKTLCRELATRAWDDHQRFDWDLVTMEGAVARAVACGLDERLPPVLLSDLGDNAGAGGPSNTIWLLEGLYNAGARRAFVGNFLDPALVARACEVGVGNSFEAIFTGDTWGRDDDGTFRAPVTVQSLHDGVFLCRHGINAGRTLLAGPTALLRLDDMWVSVTSKRLICNDPVMIEALGLEMTDIRSLAVKGRGSYRVAFDPWISWDDMLRVDTPGRTSPVLDRYEWKKLPRPVFPIDRDVEWQVPKLA